MSYRQISGSERLSNLSQLLLSGGNGVIAMLGAYFDASGTDDKSLCLVMGGFVAPVDRWVAFEHDWAVLLKEKGLEYAHARKLRQWRDDRREQFYLETNYLLRRTVLFAPATTIRHADYKRVYPDNTISHKDSIYGMCFRATMVSVCMHVRESWPEEEIAFIVESGDAGQGSAQKIADLMIKGSEIFNQLRLVYPIKSFSFANKRDFGALQVADMHAYCKLKNDESFPNRKKGEYRGDITYLLNEIRVSHFEIDREVILRQRKVALERKSYDKRPSWLEKEIGNAAATIRRGSTKNAK